MESNDENDDARQQSAAEIALVLSDLTARAKVLLSELETFREHLRNIRQEQHIEAAHFRGTVQSELGMLERLSQKPAGDPSAHIARSSNLPFLESVWNIAKQYTQLTALHKKIYFNSPNKSLAQTMRHLNLKKDSSKLDSSRKRERMNSSVIVDAVTNGGLVWIKLSLVTNTRILFDLAKQGWNSGGSDEGDFSDIEEGSKDDPNDDVPLVKTAKELHMAATSSRIRTRHPTVHLMLPRIEPGKVPEVDDILDKCRAAGVVLICGQDIARPALNLDILNHMVPDPFHSFSDTLNIDCTILLALVSEFSHAKVSKEPWFHTALKRQVEIEGNENLLPSLLYPALGAHPLVCTREAATRMREIVDTIGTPSEKARTAIMMGDDAAKSQPALIAEMQNWSAYPVPADWQLPITVQAFDEPGADLPPEARVASQEMTTINKSVFLYGWATGRTTITSNRTVVRGIETALEKYEDLDAGVWPKIWLCPTARSLVGKEKRGGKKEEKKEGAWPLPDPLRREEQRRNGLDVLSSREGHPVEDRRPNGYPCDEVLEAKNAARRHVEEGV